MSQPVSDSTSPAKPTGSPYGDRYPLVSEGTSPLRETYLANLAADQRDAVAAPLALIFHLVLEASTTTRAYGEVPSLHEQAAAVARDLRWTVGYLRGGLAGPAFGSCLEHEEETLARYLIDYAAHLDQLTATLERFLASWRGPEERPEVEP